MATGDKIEIWDSNKYKQFFDSISSDALSELGKDVMGGAKPEN
jgi:MraZ protein